MEKQITIASIIPKFFVIHIILFLFLAVMMDGGFITAPASYYFFVFLPYFVIRVLFQTIRNRTLKISENEQNILILLPIFGIGIIFISYHLALSVILKTFYEDAVVFVYPTVFSH